MFVYTLEKNVIDGVITAGHGYEPWKLQPIVVSSPEEILAARGTRYNISPNITVI